MKRNKYLKARVEEPVPTPDPLQDFQDAVITSNVVERVARSAPPRIEEDDRGFVVVDPRSAKHEVRVRCKTEKGAEEVLAILKKPSLDDEERSRAIGRVLSKEAFER